VTPAALEGIEAVADRELLVAGDARAFADQVVAALSATEASAVGAAARRRVLADFDWNNNLATFDRLLEGPAP
jgi:glycosyltransferase involved in cell wall biosynthesis